MEQMMIDVATDTKTKSAQDFLQCLHEDHDFKESLLRLTSSDSLTEVIESNGFHFDELELVKAFIEQMEDLGACSDGCDCSLYERGLLELL